MPLALSSATALLDGFSAGDALVVLGLGGGVLQQLLLGWRQLFPEALAGLDRVGRVDMVGLADELVHFVQLAGQDHRIRVLLAVDRLVLQRTVELGKRHRDRVSLEGLEGLDEHRVRDHAQLQAVQVLALQDRPLAVGDVAKAQVKEAQHDDALVGEPCR
jgi:hypothetical protein